MTRPARSLLSRLRRSRLRGLDVDRTVVRNGDPVSVAYLLLWCHVAWAVGLALSGGQVVDLYDSFPLFRLHVWDGLALVAAGLLRSGIGRLDLRRVQAGAVLGFVLWGWAAVAFWAAWGGPSAALVYAPLAGGSAWVVYLAREAWIEP